MSVKLMNEVFEITGLGPTERLVLLALADHHNDKDGSCYPSIDRLCARTGLSKRAVQTNIQKLTSGGYLLVKVSTGRGNSNAYIINTKGAPAAPFDEIKGAPDAPINSEKGASGAIKGASGAEKGASGAPQPLRTIKEPEAAAVAQVRDGLENEPRVKLLAAMGVGPDGIAGPSKFIGNPLDMAEAENWRDMGLSVPKQCEIIADVCRRLRAKDPGWTPARFKYFTPAMADVVKAKTTPIESQNAAQIDKWKRMAAG